MILFRKRGTSSIKTEVGILGILLFLLAIIYLMLPNAAILFTGHVIGIQSAATPASISVNTDQEIGQIRSDFYGANTHGAYLGNGTLIDINSDGISESPSDLNWHRQAWLDSGMKYMRWDANLGLFYSNGTSNNFSFTGNLYSRIAQLQWAHNHGIRVLLIIDYMPTWLADASIIGCDNSSNLSLSRCPPYNYTIWQDIVVDYLNRLTVNGTYASDIDVEVWNEPDLGFWLGSLPTDNSQKSIQYNILYNNTQRVIKNVYPSISVGGPALSWIIYTNITKGFLSNFSNDIDFFSLHRYTDNAYTNLLSDTNSLLNYCQQYNANCRRIIWSEWNTWNPLIKNSSENASQFGANTALGYTTMLNNYPSNVSMILYQWSEQYQYGAPNYPEYPKKWSMVSEPNLDNEFNPSYNVTKDFAHFHSSGNIVINSSSTNSSLRVVASKNDSDTLHVTLISTSANDINATISLSGALSQNYSTLQDIKTGDNFTISNGAVNVGVMQRYDIKYLEALEVISESQNVSQNDTQNETQPDSTPPIVTIVSPLATTYTDSNISVIINADENSTCSYSLDSGAVNISLSSDDNIVFTGSNNLSNGNYDLTAYCLDFSNNTNSTITSFIVNVTENVSVDTTPPIITINDPTNTIYAVSDITISVDIDEIGSCTYTLNSGSQQVFATSDNLAFSSSENLSNGNYTLDVSCSDLSNNANNASVTFAVNVIVPDTTAPIITISSPISAIYTTNNISVNLNLNEIGNCLYSFDSGVNNRTLSTIDHLAFSADENNLPNGDYTITAYCNDSSNNFDSSSVSFSVNVTETIIDSVAPEITINSPANAIYTTDDINVDITINEQGQCVYSLNAGSSNKTLSTGNNIDFSANENNLANGNYGLVAYCSDLSGNNADDSVNFVINVTIPQSNNSTNSTNNNTSSGGSSSGGSGSNSGASPGVVVNTTPIVVPDTITVSNISIGEEITPSGPATPEETGSAEDSNATDKTGNETIKSGRGILGRAVSDFASGLEAFNLGAIIMLLAGCIVLILGIMAAIMYYRIRHYDKHEAVTDQLEAWISKARKLGYNNEQMEELLLKSGWNKDLVKKAIFSDTKKKV